jgi:hypothetical protein
VRTGAALGALKKARKAFFNILLVYPSRNDANDFRRG